MRRNIVFWSFIVCFVVGGVVFLAGNSSKLLWQGSTHLTIEFTVSDEGTGRPVSNARIAILDIADLRGGPFIKLETDDAGAARHELDCRSGGARGVFTNTYYVTVPNWTIRVSAPEYRPADPISLSSKSNEVEGERGANRLKIHVRLKKNQEHKSTLIYANQVEN